MLIQALVLTTIISLPANSGTCPKILDHLAGDQFLPVSSIHKMMRATIRDKDGVLAAQEKLHSALRAARFFLSETVYRKIDDAFTYEHEIAFTLYRDPQSSVFTVAENNTDYDSYKQLLKEGLNYRFKALVNRKKRQEARTRNESLGFVVGGSFHTHPCTLSEFQSVNKRDGIFIRNFCKGGIANQANDPSQGDILNWIWDRYDEGYILIGYKFRENHRLKIRAFVPVAARDRKGFFSDEGWSALKPKGTTFGSTKISKNTWDRTISALSKDILVKVSRPGNDQRFWYYAAYVEVPVIVVP